MSSIGVRNARTILAAWCSESTSTTLSNNIKGRLAVRLSVLAPSQGFAPVALSSKHGRGVAFLHRLFAASWLRVTRPCACSPQNRVSLLFPCSCASHVRVNEAHAHLKRRNPMILKITHKAAQLLAIQDAKRAMKKCDYDGVSFTCGESLRRLPLQGPRGCSHPQPSRQARARRRRDVRRGVPGRLASGLMPGSAGFGPRTFRWRRNGRRCESSGSESKSMRFRVFVRCLL